MKVPVESTLRRHAQWVDLHYGFWAVREHGLTKGNRRKFVAHPDPIMAPIRRRPYQYYWKESLRRYPLEFWSEVLAYHIGAVVGVQVSPCFPARYEEGSPPYASWRPDRYGALSLSLIEPTKGESLIHGGDLLSLVKPDYERVRGSDHSVQLVIRALDEKAGDLTLYRQLFAQFVFDALIGNSDRHQDNWGLRLSYDDDFNPSIEVLPAFDNGSSLGRELIEEKVLRMLRDHREFDSYVSRGTAHIRWQDASGLERLTHIELLRRHILAFPRSRDSVMALLQFRESTLRRAISRVCQLSRTVSLPTELLISPAREELICRLVLLRREKLAQL